MGELSYVARMVRSMADSYAIQLEHIPEDKLSWKPTPEAKSAFDVTAEVISVFQMATPLFTGGTFNMEAPRNELTSLADAKAQLAESAAAFAAALDAAGDELNRPVETPFGAMWAAYGVLFPVIDLIHHHGQVTYIQSLLGDAEFHFDPNGIQNHFAPPQ